MPQNVLSSYEVKPGNAIATKTRRRKPGRLRPYEVFYPPDYGHPRLRHKCLEVLWLMSQGIRDSDIYRIVGCHKSYPGAVRERHSRLTPEQLLNKYQSIPWVSLL